MATALSTARYARSPFPAASLARSSSEFGEFSVELRNLFEHGRLTGSGNLGRPVKFSQPESRDVGLNPEIHSLVSEPAKVVRLRLVDAE